MYVLEVIPLTALPPNTPQILTYYHDYPLPKGAIVEVLLNNRAVNAAVVDSSSLDEQKIIVKKSSFQIKKTARSLSDISLIANWQFKIALWLANTYSAPLGLCLKSILPPFLLKARYPVTAVGSFMVEPDNIKARWIISRAKNSADHIQKILDGLKSGQAVVIVPDASYLPFFENSLKSYGPGVLTSSTKNKDFYKIWNEVSMSRLKIIIGTRQSLFLPFADLRHVGIIDPLHEFYKSDMSPKYWTPELAEMIASSYGAKLTAISPILGVTAFDSAKRGQIDVADNKTGWPARTTVVDLAAEFKRSYFGTLSPEAKDVARQTLAEGGQILILASRRGYSGILLCQRCGYSVKCPDCDFPMRVHQGVNLSLLCHHCGHSQSYPYACPNCRSAQIKPTGPVGSQKIFEELQKMMTYGQIPRAPVLIMDADVTQNQTEEDEIMAEIRSGKPLILIATQKIFSYGYDTSFDSVIVPQLDALSVGSDFRTAERLWYRLEKITDFNPKDLVVQTFHQNDMLGKLAKHDYQTLYEEELAARKSFWYPPYSRLITLTYSHPDWRKVSAAARAAVEKLKLAAVHIKAHEKIKVTETSPLFLRKEKGVYIYSIIVKIDSQIQPREFLRYAPAQWLINVDPRTTT